MPVPPPPGELLDRVRRTLRSHQMVPPGGTVVVALSGGPDSVALTHLLLALEASESLKVAGLAHFNHELRPTSGDDERFCAGLAAAVGRPFLADRADVAAHARRERCSIESAARTLRHAFLARAREHFRADVVALGHTRDDQAETFLLRLLRGAGSRGLAAMHPRRGHIVRPLIDCRRGDLTRYLTEARLPYVVDESNADVAIPRNRVRVELLPLLERRFNPAVVDALAAEAAIARDEWSWMEGEARELAARAVVAPGGVRNSTDKEVAVWRLDTSVLNAAHPALVRRVLRNALIEAARGRPVSFANVEQAGLLVRQAGPTVDGPGFRVERCGSEVVVTARPRGATGRPVRQPEPNFEFSLSIPGKVEAEPLGWRVSADVAAEPVHSPGAVAGTGDEAAVRLDRIVEPLRVRNRRPGDRFSPPGLIGRKKLQDFFVDRKVDRASRDRVPIVVDGRDRIVWVGGYAIDREFAVTDPAQAVLILRLKLLGGRV